MTIETHPEHRNWAMACHLSSLIVFIGIPFGNLIGPLLLWMIKKDEMPFVNQQGKEVLNFQLTMTIAYFFAFILCFVLIGFLLLFILGIFNLVVTTIAAVKSNQGIAYRYPLCIRMI